MEYRGSLSFTKGDLIEQILSAFILEFENTIIANGSIQIYRGNLKNKLLRLFQSFLFDMVETQKKFPGSKEEKFNNELSQSLSIFKEPLLNKFILDIETRGWIVENFEKAKDETDLEKMNKLDSILVVVRPKPLSVKYQVN